MSCYINICPLSPNDNGVCELLLVAVAIGPTGALPGLVLVKLGGDLPTTSLDKAAAEVAMSCLVC